MDPTQTIKPAISSDQALEQFKETVNNPITKQEEDSSSSPSLYSLGENEDDVTTPGTSFQPEQQIEQNTVQTESPNTFYNKIGEMIEKNPQLQSSWNQWFSENILGVRMQPQQQQIQSQQMQVQPQIQRDPRQDLEEWTNLLNHDDPAVRLQAQAALADRIAENKIKAVSEQYNRQLNQLFQFTTNVAKSNFEASVSNDPVYSKAKPIFDTVIQQVPSEQLQQNPQLFNIVYNTIVGQLYREGHLNKPTQPQNKGTLSPVPGSTMAPASSKSQAQLTKEEQMLLRRYSNDISYEDYVKYGGGQ